jgi:hypothetical protein
MASSNYQVVGRPARKSDGTREYTDWIVYTGCDIIATFDNKVQLGLEGITWSVRRDVAPVYTLGQIGPRSHAKGKRAIAGSMVFSVSDREEVLFAFYPNTYSRGYNYDGNGAEGWDPWTELAIDKNDTSEGVWIARYNYESKTGTASSEATMVYTLGSTGDKINGIYQMRAPHFLDEIPPFNVTLTMTSETGASSAVRLLGCVFVNEAQGYSMNTMVPEKSASFFCMDVIPIHPIPGPDQKITSAGISGTAVPSS